MIAMGDMWTLFGRTAGGECAVERFKYNVILAAGSGHSQPSYSPIGGAMGVQNRIP